MAPKPRPLIDRKISVLQPENIDQKKESTTQIPTSNEKKPPILQTVSPDKIKSSTLTPEVSDKKGSTSKILKDFIDFTPPVIPSDKNITSTTVKNPTQKDQNKSQSSDDYSKTTKEGGSETTSSTIDENKRRNRNYKWLAAAAVGLFGIGSVRTYFYELLTFETDSCSAPPRMLSLLSDHIWKNILQLCLQLPYGMKLTLLF